jgi:cell cycle sensor histidine kinase DivJ
MLLALIGNGIAFTQEDARISVSLKAREARAMLTVADNGAGIAPGEHGNVWSRYLERRQLDDPLRGAGFGLPLVYSVARRHGGGAVLESRPGAGTSVIVSLPILDPPAGARLMSEVEEYGAGSEMLVELSDVLPPERFLQRHID